MNYIDLTQATDKDTTNYNELSNQPQINGITLTGNKSSTDLGIFLPDGYTINVATDGSGDFTDIQSAINSLEGKVCAGTVNVNIAAGTYTVTNPIYFSNIGNVLNLQLAGAGESSTIINYTGAALNWTGVICTNKVAGILDLTGFTLQYKGGSTAPASNDYTCGIGNNNVTQSCIVYIHNITLQGFQAALRCEQDTKISESITITNCTKGISAYVADVKLQYYVLLTITNATIALQVDQGGTIRLASARRAFTNVTNQTSQSIGTATTAGWITGSFSN